MKEEPNCRAMATQKLSKTFNDYITCKIRKRIYFKGLSNNFIKMLVKYKSELSYIQGYSVFLIIFNQESQPSIIRYCLIYSTVVHVEQMKGLWFISVTNSPVLSKGTTIKEETKSRETSANQALAWQTWQAGSPGKNRLTRKAEIRLKNDISRFTWNVSEG